MQRFDLKQFRRQAGGMRELEWLDFVSMAHWGWRPNGQSPVRGGSGPQSLAFSVYRLGDRFTTATSPEPRCRLSQRPGR